MKDGAIIKTTKELSGSVENIPAGSTGYVVEQYDGPTKTMGYVIKVVFHKYPGWWNLKPDEFETEAKA